VLASACLSQLLSSTAVEELILVITFTLRIIIIITRNITFSIIIIITIILVSSPLLRCYKLPSYLLRMCMFVSFMLAHFAIYYYYFHVVRVM
jgi:hypothetical protein